MTLPTIILYSDDVIGGIQLMDFERNHISFIKKPFRLLTLLRNLEDNFRYQNLTRDKSLRMGPYLLDTFEKVLLDDANNELTLTDTEVKILKILFLSSGVVVAKEMMLNKVWGIKNSLETHTLESHIYRLRKKSLKVFEKGILIQNASGGYLIEYKS